jgi:hypothetical protein
MKAAGLVVIMGALVGCGGRLGPLVTDVTWTARGELLVTRCMLEVSGGGSSTSYELEDCQMAVLPPPHPAALVPPSGMPTQMPAAPPPDSSATVHHGGGTPPPSTGP